MKALGLPRQSAYDLLNDYERASALPERIRKAAEAQGVDIAKKAKAGVLKKLVKLSGTGLDKKTPSQIKEAVATVVDGEKKRKRNARSITKKKGGNIPAWDAPLKA